MVTKGGSGHSMRERNDRLKCAGKAAMGSNSSQRISYLKSKCFCDFNVFWGWYPAGNFTCGYYNTSFLISDSPDSIWADI